MRSNRDFRLGPWLVRSSLNLVEKEGRTVRLEPRLTRVLCCLARSAPRLVTKDELWRRVWPGTFISDDVLTKSISELRRALDDRRGPLQMIATVPKAGYRLLEAPFWLNASETESRPVVAVLPFQVFGGSPGSESFSDGLQEEITLQLARLAGPRLAVVARTSAGLYKNTRKSIRQIGDELGADLLIEGSVRGNRTQFRVTAQLIEAENQSHLWADSFDYRERDPLALQSEVARGIVDQIVRIGMIQSARAGTPAPAMRVPPEAYDEYLRGRALCNRRQAEALAKAVARLERAIELAPGYAEAHSGLAIAHNMRGYWMFDPPCECFPLAEQHAARAIEIDPGSAEAHAAHAYARLEYDWDFAAAQKGYESALALNPNCLLARQWYAEFLGLSGQLEAFEGAVAAALQLDPHSLPLRMLIASKAYMLRDNSAALRELKGILDMDEHFHPAYHLLGAVYHEMGDYGKAVRYWLKALQHAGIPANALGALRQAYRQDGIRGWRNAEAELLQQTARRAYVSPVFIAMDYACLGDADRAFAWLETAVKDRSGWLLELGLDPVWEQIRSDTRFRELARRVGIPGPV